MPFTTRFTPSSAGASPRKRWRSSAVPTRQLSQAHEDWTSAVGASEVEGTVVRGERKSGRSYLPNYIDFSSLEKDLEEPQRAALWAALGTTAPTQWIAPSTYEVAFGNFAALRRDPLFLDP